MLSGVEHTMAEPVPTVSEPTSNIENLDVLLVEDNPSTRKMVKIFLEYYGINVLEASDGLEGIKEFKSHQPAVCVVDIGLPDCNGFEVAKQIRASGGQSPVLIALTGYGLPKDCLLYTSPSPRDATLSRMPSSA